MSLVVITIDTEAQTITAKIGDREVTDINYVSAYTGPNYYGKGTRLSWNINTSEDTGDDDYNCSTNFCSAAEIESLRVADEKAKAEVVESAKAEAAKASYEKTKADIADYMLNRRK